VKICSFRGCTYWTLLDPERCDYHAKKDLGLFDVGALPRRSTLLPSHVLTGEQVELARLLDALGAEGDEIRAAFSRR
jgi:hypothetical protein